MNQNFNSSISKQWSQNRLRATGSVRHGIGHQKNGLAAKHGLRFAQRRKVHLAIHRLIELGSQLWRVKHLRIQNHLRPFAMHQVYDRFSTGGAYFAACFI